MKHAYNYLTGETHCWVMGSSVWVLFLQSAHTRHISPTNYAGNGEGFVRFRWVLLAQPVSWIQFLISKFPNIMISNSKDKNCTHAEPYMGLSQCLFRQDCVTTRVLYF